MKKTLLALLLALSLVLMSACSAPTAEPTVKATEAPTAEPTVEATEEPAAEPTEEPAAVIGGADEQTDIVVTDEQQVSRAAAKKPVAEEPAAELAQENATDGEAEQQEDIVLASAYDGAVTVKRSDVEEEFDQLLESYIAYYAQSGYEMDEYDQDFQASVAQETVQLHLSKGIVEHFAAQNGYELTAQKEEELRAQAKVELDNVREQMESYLAYYGYEGEELEKIVEDELAASGYTEENLYDSVMLNDVLNFIFGLATEGVTVTDEEVKASFDAKVAAQQESYADVDTFINDYIAAADILYTPENVRLMQCIYIALVDGEATPGEATPDEATPAEAGDPAELTGYAKAQAVLAAIRGGQDFVEAMKAYNEDTSTEEQMLSGCPVAEASAMYSEEFQAGAMALEQIGDVSDVIVTDYGYFILYYAKDLTPGVVEFEPRKEAETAEALSNKENDAYSTFIDGVLEEANVQIGDLSSLYHVYVAEVVEATVAYASVEEETALTDMPGGDTVATLSAGASMDVLGHIGIDGETYAFVAVPGTQIKGYINEASMKDMDEEAALAVDNSALVQAAPAVDKLPTFTIAMNDGSLIYGELYPDVAPESVGNFVTLANEGFYDGLIFHRVVPGFVIQGGDPNGDGTGGPGYAIRGEFESNGITNDLSHTRGVLSMARSTAADSAGSQFFIMHADNDYLDGDYAGFGMVLGGIETVDLIASVPTNSNDKPMSDQVMRAVYVETYGQTYTFTKLED